MPNRPGSDDRNTPGGLGDRGGQREAGDGVRGGAGGASSSTRQRSNRGFASMDRTKQREIASKGGKAAHAKGTAHEFDSSEAREAGRKGGVAVSRNREHMAAIGRRGGEARGHSRSRAAAHPNTGASDTLAGSYQNTRGATAEASADTEEERAGSSAGSAGERQVPIDGRRESGSESGPPRSHGGTALGERRLSSPFDERLSGSESYNRG